MANKSYISESSSLLGPDCQINEPFSGENLRGREKLAVRKARKQAKGELEGHSFTSRQNCTVFDSLLHNLNICMIFDKSPVLRESHSSCL